MWTCTHPKIWIGVADVGPACHVRFGILLCLSHLHYMPLLLVHSLLLSRSYFPIPDFEVARNPAPEDHDGVCIVKIVRRTSHPFLCWPSGTPAPWSSFTTASGQTTSHGTVPPGTSSNFFSQGHHLRDPFGCRNDHTLFTTGACAGLFQCGNGALVTCSGNNVTCSCTGDPHGSDKNGMGGPCHRNHYTKGSICPPALPYPPHLPPSVRQMRSERRMVAPVHELTACGVASCCVLLMALRDMPQPPAPPSRPPRPTRPPAPPMDVQYCNHYCHKWFVHHVREYLCKCQACRHWDARNGHNMSLYQVDVAVRAMHLAVP